MMFRKPQYLKKLISFYSPFSIKTSYPPLNSYFSFPTPPLNLSSYSFSSSSQDHQQDDYKKELSLLKNFSWNQKNYLSKAFEKFVTSQEDVSLLNSDERKWVEWGLKELSLVHKEAGNLDTASKYLLKLNDISKMTGRKEDISLAFNYSDMAFIKVTQGKWIEAEDCVNEVSRLCKLLEGEPAVKGLTVQNWFYLAKIEDAKGNQDKALELYNSIIENIDDVLEPSRPFLLASVYREMGSIYSSRNEINQTINYWEKGFEIFTESFGEDSTEAIDLLRELLEFLIDQKQFVRAEPYAQKNLEITLETFSKNSDKAALGYFLLGKIFFAKQDLPKALDSYNTAIQILENLPEDFSTLLSDVYFSMAKTHNSLGNHPKVPDFLAKASQTLVKGKNKVKVADVYFKWAKELKELKMLAESQEYFEKALDLSDPSSKAQISSIYLALGEIASDKEEWKKALEFFKESEKYLDPADTHNAAIVSGFLDSIRSHFGSHKEKKEHFPGEMQSWELAGDISPIVLNYWNTGEFNEKQGRFKEALEAYRMAAQIYERDPMKEELNNEIIIAKISQIKEKI